jgi:hypothetical protein
MLSYEGIINRRLVVQAGPSKKVIAYLKNNQSKNGWGMVQLAECLVSKYDALSSYSNTVKKNF